MPNELSLNYWSPKEGFGRVYLNGLPTSCKVWLAFSKGRVIVQADGTLGMTPEEVLEAVTARVPEANLRGYLDWEALVAYASISRPKGAVPGSTAASRSRAASSGAPKWAENAGSWTAADAALVATDIKTHPIPEPITIVVDHREPGVMVDMLRTVQNLNVTVAALDVGDYVVPDQLYIERKTVADFVNSIVGDDKRLFHQTEAMAKSDVQGVLIVEGDIYGQKRMSIEQLTGALSYLAVIQRVSVIPTLSIEHTAHMIAKLARHCSFGLGYDLRLRGTAPSEPSAAAAFTLQGMKGVSPARARALLERFGSLRGVALASVKDLLAVDGIGPKTAKLIHDTFSTPFDPTKPGPEN